MSQGPQNSEVLQPSWQVVGGSWWGVGGQQHRLGPPPHPCLDEGICLLLFYLLGPLHDFIRIKAEMV